MILGISLLEKEDKSETTPFPVRPLCGNKAEWLAAQSIDQGKNIRWIPICDLHADGWNDGKDWQAPLYMINTNAPFFF